MNIFALDNTPSKAAEYHCDKHVVKMILEHCQLLSTAHRVLDGKEEVVLTDKGRKKKVWKLQDQRNDILYSATHINHPSAIWARGTIQNYMWLHTLTEELSKEYTNRYKRVHKCSWSGLLKELYQYPNNIKKGTLQPFALAMPDECKVADPVESYRKYYMDKKREIVTWKFTQKPSWYI